MTLNRILLAALAACLFFPGRSPADDPPSTQPTTVTLHAADADPHQVLDEIAKAAGLTAQVNPPWLWTGSNGSRMAVISVNFDHLPFWQAMAQFCAAAHCMVYPDFQGGLRVQENDQPGMLGGVMDTFGSYTIIATAVERDASVNLATNRTSHNDSLHLQLYVDPAVHVLQISQPVLTQADDDNGQSMLPDSPAQNQRLMNGQFGGLSAQGSAALKYPPQVGRRLVNVSGEWDVQVPAATTDLTINDVSSAVGQTTTAGDYSLTIVSCDLHGRSGRINLTADRKPFPGILSRIFPAVPSAGGPDFLMYKLQGGAIKLIDADGNIATPDGGGGGSIDQVQWNLNISQFNTPPTWGKLPIKLVWRIPTQTRIDSVLFHFKDLPLPRE